MMKMNRPDLVVPYMNRNVRDRVYPVIVTAAIILLTVLVIIVNAIERVI